MPDNVNPAEETPAGADAARVDRALGPVDLGHLEVSEPEDVAAGVPAVVSTAKATFGHAGVRRGLKLLARVNQTDGFDCPSCAWPDPADRSFAEFCENGAKAVADAGDRTTATPAALGAHTVDELVSHTDRWLNDLGRLTAPVIRRPGSDRFQPIGWDEAFALIGRRLSSLDDPDRAVFYTSGRASNEAAFLFQLLARSLGTNNLPDCSNMCHESSGSALTPTVGVGKGTVTLEDFDHADVIVVIGQNPGTNHPRMLTALQHAAERGASIVAVNPLSETGLRSVRNPQDFKDPRRIRQAVRGTPLAEVHLQVRVGGDLALLLGVQKALFAFDAVDDTFVADHTAGVEAVRAVAEATEWADIERESGVARAEIEALARRLAGTNKIIWCWAMGLTQHARAVDTIRQIANLALLRGAIGIPGGGLCPVRGHSNVQGDRTVGIWERPPEEFLDRLADGVGFDPPREHGLDTVESIRAMARGDVDVFMSLGGNLLSAGPDTDATGAALGQVDLTVHVVTKLNRSCLVTGETALILPCLARTDADRTGDRDQFVSCENSMGIVQRSQGSLSPVSAALRSEPAIVAGVAAAALGDTPVDWAWLVEDYDRIRDLIERSVAGFDDYNARVRLDGGFALPNSARDRDFSKLPGGRAHLSAAPLGDPPAIADDELVMMTIRSHDQFNTVVYGDDDRYRGIHGSRRVVLMHVEDAAARGLVAGDEVDLINRTGGARRVAERFQVVPYDIPRGNCATYFPEANVLVPLDSVAAESNTPTSKWVPVLVEPSTRHNGRRRDRSTEE